MKAIGFIIINAQKDCLFKSQDIKLHPEYKVYNSEIINFILNTDDFFRIRDEDVGDSFIWVQRKVDILDNMKIITLYSKKILSVSFMGNFSHELRTSLNGSTGLITLMEYTELTNEQSDYLSMMKECSLNLISIVNDVLDYAKLEDNSIKINIQEVNIRQCIESINDIISSKILQDVEYTYEISNQVPIVILTDYNRLKQIIINLLSNAVKFTDKGKISLKATIEPECILQIDIKDTGCGIHKNSINELFKPFKQLDSDITTKLYQGTGLGLVICKELSKLLDGDVILLESIPNVGSTFRLTIKYQETSWTPIINISNFVDKHILILDDKVENRIILSNTLHLHGLKVTSYSNAEEALYFCKSTIFDAGIIDICMPKIDGPTFVRRIRELSNANNIIPIIASSSLGDKNLYNTSLFTGHLIKPIKESKLLQILQDIFSKPKNSINSNKQITDTQKKNIYTNLQILIAEDIAINQKILKSFLIKLGVSSSGITIVDNGRDALDKLDKNEYNIALIDIKMPILDGEEVIKRVANKKGKTYFVAVTAYYLQDEKKKYVNLGFDDYLTKPLSISSLISCIQRYIAL